VRFVGNNMVLHPQEIGSAATAYVRRASTMDSESGDAVGRGGRYWPPLIDESGDFGVALTVTAPPRREAGDVAATSAIERSEQRSSGATLRALPRPERLAAEYEPHLIHRTVEGLLSLFEAFRDSLGSAAAAARAVELRARLSDAYREGILRPETRDFATTVSMLQDLLRPHWSQIPADRIDAVCDRFRELSSIKRLTPSAVTTFYKKVSATLGSGISLDVNEEEATSGEDG